VELWSSATLVLESSVLVNLEGWDEPARTDGHRAQALRQLGASVARGTTRRRRYWTQQVNGRDVQPIAAMTPQLDPMMGASHGMMGMSHEMVPSTDAGEDTEGGGRIVLTPKEASDLVALRKHVRDHAERMARGECPMMMMGHAGAHSDDVE
jgi:hypothetical protein